MYCIFDQLYYAHLKAVVNTHALNGSTLFNAMSGPFFSISFIQFSILLFYKMKRGVQRCVKLRKRRRRRRRRRRSCQARLKAPNDKELPLLHFCTHAFLNSGSRHFSYAVIFDVACVASHSCWRRYLYSLVVEHHHAHGLGRYS